MTTFQQELALALEQPVIIQDGKPVQILVKGTPICSPVQRANYTNGFLCPGVAYHRYYFWPGLGEESLVKIKFKGQPSLEALQEGHVDMNLTCGSLVYQKFTLSPQDSYTFDYVGYFAVTLSTVESQTLADFYISYRKELENGGVEQGFYRHGLVSHPDRGGVTISRPSSNFCWVS